MKELLKYVETLVNLGTLCKYCKKEYIHFENKYNRCLPVDNNGNYHICTEKKVAKNKK